MTIDDILSRLQSVKPHGQGFMACCPSHEDKSPSLSIGTGDDGRTLLNCFAGCTTEAVCRAMGIQQKDLFPVNGKPHATPSRIVKTYDYHDEHSQLVYQVCRYEPKSFRQRQPDGNGGWIWKMDGVERMPYRLPQVVEAIANCETVVICEGEKDCDAVFEHTNIVSTCNPGGAGKWQSNWRKYFEGADIVICPDRDEPGRIHAQDVARKLHGAFRIRIVELPDINGKSVKDAADFFSAGGSPEQFRELIDAAKDWEPQVDKPEDFQEQQEPQGEQENLLDCSGVFVLPNDNCTFSASAKQIFSVIAPTGTMFVRDGVPVEPVRKENSLRLEIIQPEKFRSRLERYGRMVFALVKVDGKTALKPKIASVDNCSALLATIEARELLPSIKIISASPILALDGDQLRTLGPGHHKLNGGIFVSGDVTPAEMDPRRAAELLLDLLSEFAFQGPGDHVRAIAGLLTPALKIGGFIKGSIPVDIAEADQSQAGKGYRQKLVRGVYGEQAYPISLKTGGVGSLDESLSAALISGKPFISIDNLRGQLDSQFLEMILTWGGQVAARVPHRGEVMIDPGAVTFQLTSNGLETTRDLVNRSSICRIRKRIGYQFKQYPEGDLLYHVQARQADYLGAVHSIIREWHRQGMLATNETRHDFREWAGKLDWICQNIFGTPPLLDGHQTAQERACNPALNWLRAVAIELENQKRLPVELRASNIYDLCHENQISIPGLRQENDEDSAVKTIGNVMKKCFSDQAEIALDHFVINRIQKLENDENYRERVIRSYKFTKTPTSPP